MSKPVPIYTHITVDPAYVNFVPGKTKLKTETLGSKNGGGVFFIAVAAVIIPLLVMLMMHEIVAEVAYGIFGYDVPVTVTGCQMVRADKGSQRPELDFSYRLNNVAYTGTDKYSGDCAKFPAGTEVTARVSRFDAGRNRLMPSDAGYISPFVKIAGLVLITLFIGLVFLASAWEEVEANRRYRWSEQAYTLLNEKGILLPGELISISGHEGDSKSSPGYWIHAEYTFLSPENKRLRGWIHVKSNNLRGVELPPAGAGVRVLYADDFAHVML